MNSNTKLLYNAISSAVKSEGYEKHGPAWHRYTPECVCVIDLQKVEWDQYFINLAVSLKQLESKLPVRRYIGSEYWHIVLRLDGLLPDRELFLRYLEFEDNKFSEDERRQGVIDAIQHYGLPFLKSLETKEGIKQKLESGNLKGALVWKKLKQFLGVK